MQLVLLPSFYFLTCNSPTEARSSCDDIVESAPPCPYLSVPISHPMAPTSTTIRRHFNWSPRTHHPQSICSDIVYSAPSRSRLLVPTTTPSNLDFGDDTTPPQRETAAPVADARIATDECRSTPNAGPPPLSHCRCRPGPLST